jgi:putative CocE/NonD family hydrolase
LLVGPWSHSTQLAARVGNRTFGPSAQVLLDDIHQRWFDHWLKDVPNGVEQEKPVRLFMMGANQWRDFSDWPPPDARVSKLYLHSNGEANGAGGDGALTGEMPGDEQPDRYSYDPTDPVPTVGGPLFPSPVDVPPGPFDQSSVERRPDVLCYTTPPLERDVTVAGPVSVELWIASTARDTDFTAKLVDVEPDGTAWNLCDGILRARYRDGFDRVTLLDPGTPVRISVDLAGTANVFRQGHRIRLEVSSSNFPRFDRNTNTGRVIATDGEHVVARNTVYHEAARPSSLTLFVVDEE